jgi:D-arabinose 1-dehydrogenase-like Zn-dependent alcohol dehydrogenase
MKAARIVKLNEPLQVQEPQTPTPEETQVLIKVLSVIEGGVINP